MYPLFYLFLGGFTLDQILSWVNSQSEKNNSLTGMGDSNSYSAETMSKWCFQHIKKSEGLRESAYYATDDERKKGISTIGYGTCYLYKENGSAFNRNGTNKVLPTDTLSKLKLLMGYDNLTNAQFAEKLIVNHSYSKGGSFSWIVDQFTKGNIPYIQAVKDVLQDWCYTSGAIKTYAPRLGEWSLFINAIKTKDLNNIATTFVALRYAYYKKFTGQAWNTAKMGWMLRVYICGMYLKGIEVKNPYSVINYDSKKRNQNLRNIEKVFKRDFGVVIDMGS